MNEVTLMWMEISFDLIYLVIIWFLVILMTRRMDRVSDEQRAAASRIRWAFALLALGDSGHVGFRVLAYALGGLETKPVVGGIQISLVGLGALTTSITVTIFYMILVDVWRLRYNHPRGTLSNLLIITGLIRLLIMALPGNQWDAVVPPQPISLLRNLPLVILGVGVMWKILIDSRRTNDQTFTWIGIMIAVSFTCYIPVILFVQQFPLIGMLMIPKTLAYLAIAFMAYRAMFKSQDSTSRVRQFASDT